MPNSKALDITKTNALSTICEKIDSDRLDQYNAQEIRRSKPTLGEIPFHALLDLKGTVMGSNVAGLALVPPEFAGQIEAIVWIIVSAFAITFIVTIMGVLNVVQIRDKFLTALFVKMVIEIVAAGLFFFYAGLKPDEPPDRVETGLVALSDTPGWTWQKDGYRGKVILVSLYPHYRTPPHVEVQFLKNTTDPPGVAMEIVVAPLRSGPFGEAVWTDAFEVTFMWKESSETAPWPIDAYARYRATPY